MTWPLECLGNVAEFINGKAFKPTDWHEEGIKIIRIQNLTNPSKPYNLTRTDVEDRYIVKTGELLVSWSATIDVFVWNGENAALNQHIFRVVPNEDIIDVNYLRHSLKNSLNQMMKYLHGSTMKHINRREFLATTIPLPPLEEQRRLAAILDKTEDIKKSSIEIQDSRLRIIQSAFIEMFGDPIINPHNYPKILFGELGTLDRGKSKHRPRNDPRLLGGNHPLIQTGEIRSADLFVDTFTNTYSDFGLAQSRKWPAGTLAITIAANIAESAILGIDACFPDSIVGFTPNSKSNSIFIKAQLDFLKDRISEVAPQSAQKNINLKILREIPMICPSIEMQEQFEDFVRNASQIFDSANKGIDMAEKLVKSSIQSLIN